MNNLLDYNFHTHTKRCNHAVDDDEKYILKAIESGIKHLGFSDHIPFASAKGYESHYRIPTSKVNDYTNSIYTLR